MPATSLTADSVPGRYSQTGQVLTETAIDVANGNEVLAADTLMIIVRNAGASSRTFTITSQPDPVTGRTGDVSQAIAAGEERLFCLTKSGWMGTNGKVSFGGNHADLKVKLIYF